ncbi:MAG: bifunctional nuclease family protein [Desulfovibrionaceae bacterium]|nr:bifunctional nuclease family protein [Desulfovibrionaceae bacterium]MDD4951409.1 bifunctional nuclease family protein [Desulfovibrionaceae bacterium]
MVEMKVFGLALDEKNQTPILILKDLEETRVLPIWIGAMEAMSISLALNKVAFPRPMTHDLMLSSLESLGGEVTAVEVTKIEQGTFFAEIVVRQGTEYKRIDSRPSDAIAIAIRAKAAVYVDRAVLDEAGVAPSEGGEQAVLKTEDADKWTEELEKLSITDIKYKM